MPSRSLEEGDCYDRSYGAGALGHVDVVHPEASKPRADVLANDAGGVRHVTSEGLKRQFVERLAARRRRR